MTQQYVVLKVKDLDIGGTPEAVFNNLVDTRSYIKFKKLEDPEENQYWVYVFDSENSIRHTTLRREDIYGNDPKFKQIVSDLEEKDTNNIFHMTISGSKFG